MLGYRPSMELRDAGPRIAFIRTLYEQSGRNQMPTERGTSEQRRSWVLWPQRVYRARKATTGSGAVPRPRNKPSDSFNNRVDAKTDSDQ